MSVQIKTGLKTVFNAGLVAVNPYELVLRRVTLNGDKLTITLPSQTLNLDLTQYNEIVVLGCGKAAAPMAQALEALLGQRLTRGAICVKYGHAKKLNTIELMEAGHPVPDANGVKAANKIIDMAKTVGSQTLVFMLSTGGGSALLPALPTGLSLRDKITVTELLLKSGADISAVNCVRKHLSRLKGGQLARLLTGATVINLLISDVAGNDIGAIASGPCAPDGTTFNDAVNILHALKIWDQIPAAAAAHLQKGATGQIAENPGSDDPCFNKVHQFILADNSLCVAACYAKALKMGCDARLITSFYTGEAREVGHRFFELALNMRKDRPNAQKPLCIICGGEATVTLPKNHGQGGRAMETALAFLTEMRKTGISDMAFLAAATDGNDGPTSAAGAFATKTVLNAADAKKIDPEAFLARHDAYAFFDKTNGLLVTGPTNTNVCDVGVIIII